MVLPWRLIIVLVVVVIAVLGIAVFAYEMYERNLPEVYLVTTVVKNLKDANTLATTTYGGVVASPVQLQDAWTAGAEWCVGGWASDGNNYFPQQTTNPNGLCGTAGLNKNRSTKVGVLVWGRKPSQSSSLGQNVLPFDGSSRWSQHSTFL